MLHRFCGGLRGPIGPAASSSSNPILRGPLQARPTDNRCIPRSPLHFRQGRCSLVCFTCQVSGASLLAAEGSRSGQLSPAIMASSGQRASPFGSASARCLFWTQSRPRFRSLAAASPGGPVAPMAPETPACKRASLRGGLRDEAGAHCPSADAGLTAEEAAVSSSEASRGSGKSPPYKVGSSDGRVTLWGLLSFIKEEKLRVGGILFALLLSSGAQLLLPMAVGQLIDAVTQRPSKLQKQQQPEAGWDHACVENDGAGSSRSNEGPAEATATAPAPAPPTTAATDTSLAHLETASPAAEGRFAWGAFREALEEKLQTPGARVGLCVALGAIGTATSFLRLYLLESTIERVACRLRSGLFRRLLHQPPEAFQNQQLGTLVKHLSQDVVTASRALTDVSFGLRCLVTSVVGIGLCWASAPLSFLLSLLLPISVAAFLLRLSARHVALLQQQYSRALQGALHRATGALDARKQLRSLNGEALEIKAFESALSGVYEAAKKSAVAVGCRYAFVFAAGSGLLVHLVYAAAALVAQGVLTGGQVMSLALYSAIVGSSLQGCATAWSDTSRAVAATTDMLQLLLRGSPTSLSPPLDYQAEVRRFQAALQQLQPAAPAETNNNLSGGPSIEFKDVWLSYPEREGQWALRGVNFKIPPGARVAILGPSGSGKTSLGALLLRLYEPQKGAILLGGIPVNIFDERFIRSLVIPVTQDMVLLGGSSLEENIVYAQAAQHEVTGGASTPALPVDPACDAACISSFASALPGGLQTPLGDRGALLSGGQRQRVWLAMALYRLAHAQGEPQESRAMAPQGSGGPAGDETSSPLPTVLLLDEATSSLDADTEHQVLLNLKERLKGETCLFISHRPGALKLADYIMVLDGGRVIQFGTKEEVLRKPCRPLQWLVSGASPVKAMPGTPLDR